MRVIGGLYKRRRFEVPHTFKARPTTDFAKESLFNILFNYTDFEGATALDLFAGTGSISLELVSRGCKRVVSVEKERAHYAFICKVMQEVGTKVWFPMNGDVFRFLQRSAETFDIVFADPPYNLPELANIPDLVFEKGLLSEEGIFVLEHGKKDDFSSHPHFLEHRNYGSVNFTFFR